MLFYGGSDADLSQSKARILAHFAENDEFEPAEYVQKIKGDHIEVQIYPGTTHWFFEDNRPDSYNPAAAKLVWERTIAFLKAQLG